MAQAAVWTENKGQDDLVWYTMKEQNDGTYKITVNMSEHKYETGSYKVDVYLTGKNGLRNGISSTKTEVKGDVTPKLTITDVEDKNTTFEAVLSNPFVYGDVKTVQFAIWSTENGQDDLRWITGTRQSNGSWKTSYDTLKSFGEYNVHVYVTPENGKQTFVAKDTFTIEKPSGKVSITNKDDVNGSFDVVVSDIQCKSGVKMAQAAVWTENKGQDDLVWYTMKEQSDGTYKITVNMSEHKYETGSYKVDVYLTGKNGLKNCAVSYVFDLTLNEQTPIMGTSNVTAQQLAAHFTKYNKNYDVFTNYDSEYDGVLAKGGAPTILDFCKMYVEEAKAEGVRADVAFSQAMVETGYLRFGGDVKPDQYNFAGLGATGNGVQGNKFESVRIGIRAQIQHLKCYASTEPLNQPLVDQRWSESLRGKAPTVEKLVGTWAGSTTYADSIKKILRELL